MAGVCMCVWIILSVDTLFIQQIPATEMLLVGESTATGGASAEATAADDREKTPPAEQQHAAIATGSPPSPSHLSPAAKRSAASSPLIGM